MECKKSMAIEMDVNTGILTINDKKGKNNYGNK